MSDSSDYTEVTRDDTQAAKAAKVLLLVFFRLFHSPSADQLLSFLPLRQKHSDFVTFWGNLGTGVIGWGGRLVSFGREWEGDENIARRIFVLLALRTLCLHKLKMPTITLSG